MADEPIEFDADSLGLNIEGIANVPVCPLCTATLTDAPKDYGYRQHTPDTRWFWCAECEAHLGYHRMKAKWLVDPHDLENSRKVRDHFGLSSTDNE